MPHRTVTLPAKIRHEPDPAQGPQNPFLRPGPENDDLSFLTVPVDYLPYAVEFYENRRRLREAIVMHYLHGKEHTPERWSALVAEASAHFAPTASMLPLHKVKSPGVINGMYDYVPIATTSPELYSPEMREHMKQNGQHPWLISLTLNTRWHTPESFLRWVRDSLVPEVIRSAQTVAFDHFGEVRPPGSTDTAVRRRLPRRKRAGTPPDVLDTEQLTERLFALACHRIRHGAAPNESLGESHRRYLAALPPGLDAGCGLDRFRDRVARIAADSRAEWQTQFGHEMRLRGAINRGLLHLVD